MLLRILGAYLCRNHSFVTTAFDMRNPCGRFKVRYARNFSFSISINDGTITVYKTHDKISKTILAKCIRFVSNSSGMQYIPTKMFHI